MTQIWYTLGPSSLGRECELLQAGATGARLTFSFGTPEIHLERAAALRRAASQAGAPFEIIADLAGGKPRLGDFLECPPRVAVRRGQTALFASTASPAKLCFPVRAADMEVLLRARVGELLIVGDRSAIFRIVAVEGAALRAEAISDGAVEQNRGVAIGSPWFRPPALTLKDEADLQAILASRTFDWVAISFCSSAGDIQRARNLAGNNVVQVIAKIETQQGLENLDEIAEHADGLMAARGDLSMAIPTGRLFEAVAAIGEAADRASKPWFLATQIMESGEFLPHPTAAEVCDLTRWLQHGAAGALLSRETVFGPRPVDAVRFVAEIARTRSLAKLALHAPT